jgi:hypothetical protein
VGENRWSHNGRTQRIFLRTGAPSRYIETQEQHHKKLTLQEEYVCFLRKNKIAYDERYIWN